MTGLYYESRRTAARLKARLDGLPREGLRQPLDPEGVRSLLIVCTGLLGDTVMCMPAMAEARRLFPRAHIVGLVQRNNLALLEPSGWFDELIVVEGSPFPLRPAKRTAVQAVRSRIAQRQCDLAMILLGDDWGATLRRLGIPVRVGVQEHAFAELLTHPYSIGSPRTWGPMERLGALRVLGLSPRSSLPMLAVSPQARSSLRQVLAEQQVYRDTPLLVLHPFGSSPHKWYPGDRALELIQALNERRLGRVVLIGGPKEQLALESIPALRSALAVNLVGRLDVSQLVALLDRANLVVSTDSGPFHLAGILRRPTIGLFRARSPEHAARYPTASVLFGHDEGRCATDCSWDLCAAGPCRQLKAIALSDILAQVDKCLTVSAS